MPSWKHMLLASLASSMLFAHVGFSQTLPAGQIGALQPDPAVEALVPASIKQRGTLNIAMMTKYRPYSFTAAGKQVGMMPEMAVAVAQTMGLKPVITTMDFPSILLGLQAKKYDIGMGEFFVRQDRLEVADFVTEWSNYDAFVVNKDSTYIPKSLSDVCGHKIAILAGSSGVPAMAKGVQLCKDAGQPAPEVSSFPEMSDATLALSSHRVDAVLTGHEVGVALIGEGQPFVASGKVGGGPTATAVARNEDSDGLLKAIQAAYLHLIKTGTYERIHKRWGTDYGVINNPTIYRKGDQTPSYAD
ncbi:transporter substrate-binding domain-containing protein [Pararobbsia silviterrae]|uniref:ABC transporter substrate-binding protein n=1 Tax=Pararobbsia silviterrae TaxID=1792498 RepID=A0A494Y4S1_9BURK|nr:transporter substrate-binding domain-containing protein [Pararobbsia silviterrae]RKP57719.1 ABC transporter substrate-binding protein [Pararobbsia silviterrae]